jgi:hypothetical protein
MDIKKPFQLQKTPNPNERSFWTIHDQDDFDKVSEDGNNGFPIADETIYKNWFKRLPGKVHPTDDAKLYGNYIYKDCDTGDGTISFLWVKVKTPQQRNTAFRTQQITDHVDWDAVLEWIQFGKETGFPLSQNSINGQGKQSIVTADRWLVPRGYRPSQNLNTIVTVEEFLSEFPYPDDQMESDEPQPTEVMWDLVGSHGSMGKCLHPEILVPAQATSGYRVVSTAGDVQAANSTAGKPWKFPPTNHKKRRDFFIMDVKFVGSQYYRKKLTFHVPVPSSKVIQESRPF